MRLEDYLAEDLQLEMARLEGSGLFIIRISNLIRERFILARHFDGTKFLIDPATEEELRVHRQLPDEYKDPITLDVMHDPVRAADGA